MLVKNEKFWIAPHILRVLPHVDQMCFFDGNSTDGTLEIIEQIKNTDPNGHKIKLVKDRDPKDLKDDYVKLFNECMWSLETDLAWFLHPDMWVINPEEINRVRNSDAIALVTHMESYAGEPGGKLYKIEQGRGELWKNIYRLRNPNLGAHYHGWYGAANEDVYFREITGDQHEHHGEQVGRYPYAVEDSGLKVMHFSDVRPYDRRLSRMVTCLLNQGYSAIDAKNIAPTHPRVSLEDGVGFKFAPAEYPAEFLAAQREVASV